MAAAPGTARLWPGAGTAPCRLGGPAHPGQRGSGPARGRRTQSAVRPNFLAATWTWIGLPPQAATDHPVAQRCASPSWSSSSPGPLLTSLWHLVHFAYLVFLDLTGADLVTALLMQHSRMVILARR
eukprot:7465145-Pyramimonas_sp.AAC.1